jgi:hypothetical protein
MRSDVTKSLLRMGMAGVFGLGLLILPTGRAQAQDPRAYGYGRPDRGAASPVDITVRHLEGLADRTGRFTSGRERSRYDNAIRHLSQFQDRYYRGDFDKDRLDQAISDVQNVVDHNPLDGRARSMLWNDLNRLRGFRASRGYGGGYGYRR